jgi:hypothetical protein
MVGQILQAIFHFFAADFQQERFFFISNRRKRLTVILYTRLSCQSALNFHCNIWIRLVPIFFLLVKYGSAKAFLMFGKTFERSFCSLAGFVEMLTAHRRKNIHL